MGPGKSSFDLICEVAITSVAFAALLFLIGLKVETQGPKPPSIARQLTELLR